MEGWVMFWEAPKTSFFFNFRIGAFAPSEIVWLDLEHCRRNKWDVANVEVWQSVELLDNYWQRSNMLGGLRLYRTARLSRCDLSQLKKKFIHVCFKVQVHLKPPPKISVNSKAFKKDFVFSIVLFSALIQCSLTKHQLVKHFLRLTIRSLKCKQTNTPITR